MHGRIKLCVDSKHETAEVGQTRGFGDARTGDKENFSARVCEKQAFGNGRQASTQRNHSVAAGSIPNWPFP